MSPSPLPGFLLAFGGLLVVIFLKIAVMDLVEGYDFVLLLVFLCLKIPFYWYLFVTYLRWKGEP